MLTVWCVCVGDKYSTNEVLILQDMVDRNLETPHRFKCLSDRERDGVDTFIPDEIWPGWWSKLLLFRYAAGPCLYLDLDVVVTGPLDGLLSDTLSMPANWAQSGHGGCQSSVMAWDENLMFLADLFDVNLLGQPQGNYGHYGAKRLWGDQEYITDLLGEPGDRVKAMPGVYSYKYHCRERLPEDASVVCFHGDPKPDKVNDSWVVAARSSTATAA